MSQFGHLLSQILTLSETLHHYSLVAVIVVDEESSPAMPDFNNAQPYSEGASFYITAAWGEEDIYAEQVPPILMVGDDMVFAVSNTAYRNVPLRSNTRYSIRTRYDIRNEAGGEVSRTPSNSCSQCFILGGWGKGSCLLPLVNFCPPLTSEPLLH